MEQSGLTQQRTAGFLAGHWMSCEECSFVVSEELCCQLDDLELRASYIGDELSGLQNRREEAHPVLDSEHWHGQDNYVRCARKLQRSLAIRSHAIDCAHLQGGGSLEKAQVPAVDAAAEPGGTHSQASGSPDQSRPDDKNTLYHASRHATPSSAQRSEQSTSAALPASPTAPGTCFARRRSSPCLGSGASPSGAHRHQIANPNSVGVIAHFR